MIRTKRFQRFRILFAKASSTKFFGFVMAMFLLAALDLLLVISHRHPASRLVAGNTVAGRGMSTQAQPTAQHAPSLANADVLLFGLVLLVLGTGLFYIWKRYENQVRELDRLRTELRTSNAANLSKSLFLANTSHEIRTPLGAILGFTKLLQDPNTSPTEREAYVSIIQKTGESLNSIINDILDLSKVEAGHLQVEKSWFLLKPLLREVIKICQAKYGKKEVEIVLDFAPSVDEFVFSDPERLKQILINVLGNALKFTKEGKIVLYLEQQDRSLNFKIRDSGIGIRAEDQSRLFQTFSQIQHSTTEGAEGTGLGLVLSRNLARLLGGELSLEYSRPAAGSSFVLSLPRENAIAVVPGPDSHSERKNSDLAPSVFPEVFSSTLPSSAVSLLATEKEVGLGGKDGKRVLLVDDSEINRLLMKRVLHQRGLHVETANNGEEAVRRAMDGDFDALLMDVQMPVMNGHEAARQLRQMGYSGPIIALTAHAMKEDRDRCLEAGYSDYLSKPLQFADLDSTLERAINHPVPQAEPPA